MTTRLAEMTELIDVHWKSRGFDGVLTTLALLVGEWIHEQQGECTEDGREIAGALEEFLAALHDEDGDVGEEVKYLASLFETLELQRAPEPSTLIFYADLDEVCDAMARDDTGQLTVQGEWLHSAFDLGDV